MNEFPGIITTHFHNGRGYVSVYINDFLDLPSGWVKEWIKKIADDADYDEELHALEILEKYLSYNSDRLEDDVKKWPDIQKDEAFRIDEELESEIKSLNNLRAQRRAARKRNPDDGKYYYDSSGPTEFEISQAEIKVKVLKNEKKDLDKKGKQLSRSFERCKSNAEIIRKKLEAIR